MKYFIDTEFLEGTQKTLFGKTKPTIDLISIGIKCEDGREYYVISKDFNLKEAWNRFDLKLERSEDSRQRQFKDYWIRNNVLKPVWIELRAKEVEEYNDAKRRGFYLEFPVYNFNCKSLKRLLNKYGKYNKQIAEEIKRFTHIEGCFPNVTHEQARNNTKVFDASRPSFYGYYSDYDWVVFCWLFGRMIDLPKGFPMYCIDLQQTLEELQELEDGSALHESLCGEYPRKALQYKECTEYPKQTNEHNALADARWNFELYKFLQDL